MTYINQLDQKLNDTRHPSCYLDVSRVYRVYAIGFPLLALVTGMDFEDTAGDILLGTSRGELCLVRFLAPGLLTPGRVLDGLPVSNRKHINSLSKVRDILSPFSP